MLWPTDILAIETWLLLLTIVIALRIYVHRKWKVLKKWNIPHDPPSFWNLGNWRQVFSSEKYFTYELECKKKYGPVWGYYDFITPRIVIHDPEILEQICVKKFSNFKDRFDANPQANGKELSNSLFWIGGEQWRRVRSSMTPPLGNGKLREMSYIVDWCADNSIKAFDRILEHGDGSFNAKDFFYRLSLDVICSTAFGQNVNMQDETKKDSELFKHANAGLFKTAFSKIAGFIVVTFHFLTPISVWLGGRQGHVVYFRNLCKKFIQKKEENHPSHKRVDLMQHMLNLRISDSDVKAGAHKGLTTDELIGNSMLILLAGHETAGTALGLLAYNLATHPDVQRKLQEEIDEAFRGKEKVDFDTVLHLKYLDMCVNESLRVYSPGSKTARTAEKDITINGLTIPRGCVAVIPLWALARDPDFWDEPVEFNPERMRNLSETQRLIFMPFGAGPRRCIGQHFAYMILKLAFCNILRRYSFEQTAETPKPPIVLEFDLITRAKADFGLRVVPRS